MYIAGARCRPARKPIQAILGWILATFIVIVAIFGPPLTSQSIATGVELRHDVLTIDREFERLSIRPGAPSAPFSTLMDGDISRVDTGSTQSEMRTLGDIS
jgi:hypothetical protein